MKEHGMTIIDKKCYIIKMKCQNKIFNNIVLDLIFGIILQLVVLRDMKMDKEDFIMFIEMFFKKLKQNNQKHIIKDRILNKI